MDLIHQGGVDSKSDRRLAQIYKSDSTIIARKSKLDAKVNSHWIASVSAWRERVVFTFFALEGRAKWQTQVLSWALTDAKVHLKRI